MTRNRSSAVAVVATLVVAACQPGQATNSSAPSTNTGAPATAPSAAVSAGPTEGPATPIPELLSLTLDDGGPILTPADGPEDARYSLPAAGARARDGTYVLLIVWFFAEQGDARPVVTVATSSDARTWRVGRDPILAGLGVGLARPGPIPTALVELDDGSWLLYGWAEDVTHEGYVLNWRASAQDLAGPWELDRDRLLAQGGPGTWDSRTASVGAVQATDAGFAAWYEGQSPGSGLRGDLGYASSQDGLSWTKFDDPTTTEEALAESDPVVRRGVCGPGTERALFQPQVETTPGGYQMVFGGFGSSSERMALFGAVSTDGARWGCATPEPLLDAQAIPRSQGIHSIASFPLGDGRVAIIVESLGASHSDLWLATVEPLG